MVVTQPSPPELELKLPTGWKFKNIVGLGARSKKIVYYESPSGYLYRSPESVLSHMRTSGQYSKEQISEFQQEVSDFEETKNATGLGMKRKSEDVTHATDKQKHSRLSDLQKVLKDISDVKKFESDSENVTKAEIENIKSCKIRLPRLTSEQLNLNECKSKSVKNLSEAALNIQEVNSDGLQKLKLAKDNLKLEDMKLKYKTYVEVFDEKFIPDGWKVIEIPHYMPQNEGMTISMRRFVSPKGTSFSRPQACAYLEKQSDTVNLEIMKNGLLAEGWVGNDQHPIPDGFYFRRHSGNQSVQFVRPDWGILKGMKKYKEYLENYKYDQKYIEDIKLMKKIPGSKEKSDGSKDEDMDRSAIGSDHHEENHFTDVFKEIVKSEDTIDNKNSFSEDKDYEDSFPEGWKVTHLGKVVVISCPNGNKFSSRRHALEFMLKSGEDQTSIVKVWRTLSKEGWQEGGNFLPTGWRISTSLKQCKFLNREMKILVNSDEVIKYLQNDASYSETNMENFLKWVKKYGGEGEVKSTLPWTFHQDLPEGWKILKSLSGVKYKDPVGNIFENKIAGISYMISKVYKPEEIYKLWNTLDEDGWKLDTNLPTGWRRKSVNAADNFLSPMMEVFNSWTELSRHILSSQEFTPIERSKVKKMLSDDEKCRSL